MERKVKIELTAEEVSEMSLAFMGYLASLPAVHSASETRRVEVLAAILDKMGPQTTAFAAEEVAHRRAQLN